MVPPVAPDDPQKGVPSDHSVPIATPRSNISQDQSRQYKTIHYRPFLEEGVKKFGVCLENENWTFLDKEMNPSDQVRRFEAKLMNDLEACLPLKKLKISSYEKPWINFELKYLDRRKKREYAKNGRSEKYRNIKAKFDKKFKEAAGRYINKNVNELRLSNPGKAYKILKRMGAPPGEAEDEGAFTLQTHSDLNLSTEESLEKVAEFFAQVSQEYPPLNCDMLPDRVRAKLKSESKDQNQRATDVFSIKT